VDCGAETCGDGSYPERCLSCSRLKHARMQRAGQEARMKEAIRLRSLGLRNGEIAVHMGTTSQGVANLLHRAKARGWDVPRDPYMGDRRKALAA
jgi:transposase